MLDDFIKTDEPEIDVEKIMSKIIKKETDRRRQMGDESIAHNKLKIIKDMDSESAIVEISTIRSSLSSAKAYADVGEEVPPMLNFRGIIRKIAILVARIITYLSSFITYKQRAYNEYIIDTLKIVSNVIEKLDNRTREADEKIKVELKKRDTKIRELENSITQSLEYRDNHIKKLENTISSLENSIVMQEKRITTLFEEVRNCLPESISTEKTKNIAEE